MRKGIVLLLLLGTAISAFSAPKGFVYRSGRHFALNNKVFYFGGTNEANYLLLSNRTRVDNMVTQCKAHNAIVLRVWAFGNGTGYTEPQWPGNGNSFQPTLGTFNDTAFRRIDYGLQKAGANGIRLIVVLVNNWANWYHGEMQWYVDKRVGTGQAKSLFYTNASVKQDFKNYINYVVNRTNSLTGVKYMNDSAIFSWELCNEPRNTGAGDGTAEYNWVNEIAAYIKSIDPNHMVATGEEGGGTMGSINPAASADGADFSRNTGCSSIDWACVHLYPTHWNGGFTSLSATYTYLNNRLTIAHNLNKPVALEEFGLDVASWAGATREANSGAWLRQIMSYDYDGFNVWQMSDIKTSPNPTAEETAWDIDFSSSAADTISKYAAAQIAKSGQVIDPSALLSLSSTRENLIAGAAMNKNGPPIFYTIRGSRIHPTKKSALPPGLYLNATIDGRVQVFSSIGLATK